MPSFVLFDLLSVHTYRIMTIGCTLIGGLAGAMGALIYLRKRTLMSDVIGHSATTGVMLAFMIGSAIIGVDGRSLWLLVAGSVAIGTLAAVMADRIAHVTRVSIDAAMAIMLALFFGLGMVLLRIIERGNYRHRGGLKDYFFGNASTLTKADVATIAVLCVVVALTFFAFYRGLSAHVFDVITAEVRGFSARLYGPLLLAMVSVAVVVGVKSVGLILMVALAAIPPAAARQWTRHLHTMIILSAIIGAVSAVLGSLISVSLGKIPTGPVIVLVLTAVLFISLFAAPRRSVIVRAIARRKQHQVLLAAAKDESLDAHEVTGKVLSDKEIAMARGAHQ
ncbi:MAG: metal ABC transporter permease [Bowdeniella nasicola]|nr:metal ABC transporter permease [Bowdeniella nasicola]